MQAAGLTFMGLAAPLVRTFELWTHGQRFGRIWCRQIHIKLIVMLFKINNDIIFLLCFSDIKFRSTDSRVCSLLYFLL
jgi:hypothetical protein